MNIFRSLMLGLGLIVHQTIVQGAGSTPLSGESVIAEASSEEIKAFFQSRGMTVVSFFGFSGQGYKDPAWMLAEAARILDRNDPALTVVNIGATLQGIGAVYELAKQKGFVTTGIVSTLARDHQVELSRFVDYVFFVKDITWGGFLPGTKQLSPTSRAMVENSDVLVAIGGGQIVRDELEAAQQSGKHVEFIIVP